MPDKANKRFFIPAKNYDIQVTINDLDYSREVFNVKIVTSLVLPYQNVKFTVYLDPGDITVEKIYGQTPVKMMIRLLTQDGNERESIIFDLMIINVSHQIPVRSDKLDSNKQKEIIPVTFTCICRNPFKSMTSVVNKVFVGTTVREILNGIAGETGVSLQLDSQDLNTTEIEQAVIPPMTLNNAIGYISKNIGVYNGVMGFTCLYNNILYIKNLSKSIKNDQIATIYHLTPDIDNKEIINDSLQKDKSIFYTFDSIKTHYIGNAIIGKTARKTIYILKPKDRLYDTEEKDIVTVGMEHGLISGGSKMFFDEGAITSSNRVKYNTSQVGMEGDNPLLNSLIAKKLSSMTAIYFRLFQNILLEKLMKVGSAIKFKTMTKDMLSFSGNYILKSTEIIFTRETDWMSSATIYLVRTNKVYK